MPRHRVPSLLAGSFALAALAAPAASAQVICVNLPVGTNGCEAVAAVKPTDSLGKQLQAAINYAATTTTDDTLLLGDGVYDNRSTFYYTRAGAIPVPGALAIRGTGIGKVTLADTGQSQDDETVEGRETMGPLSLRDLTVQGPPRAPRSLGVELGKAGSLIEHVAIVGDRTGGASSTALQGAVLAHADVTIRDTTITGFANGIAALSTETGNNLNVYRTSITASAVGISAGSGGLTLRRATVQSPVKGAAVVQALGTTIIENSVIDAPGPRIDGNRAIGAGCKATVTLRYDTVRSASTSKTGPGIGSDCTSTPDYPLITVADSILTPGTTIGGFRPGAGSPTTSITRSRWDAPVSGSDPAFVAVGPGMTTADPQFVSATDLHLQATSPLIDIGEVNGSDGDEPYLGGDRDGNPRVADGNGDGTAKPDLGAYELAPPAATPTPTPTPTVTPTPTPTPTVTPTPTPSPTPEPGTTPTPEPSPTPGPGTTPTPVPTATPTPTTSPSPTPTPTPGPSVPFNGTVSLPTPAPIVVVPTPAPALPAYTGLTVAGGKLKADAKGRVTLRLSCAATSQQHCAGTVQLIRTTGKGKRQKLTTIAKATVTVPAGKQGTKLVLKLSTAGRKLLTKAGIKLTVRTTTTDVRAGAAPVVTSVGLTVRR